MTPNDIRERLVAILTLIQEESGVETPVITDATCPLLDLPGFDSQVGVQAIGMLADELGVDIPLDVNIFVSPDGRRRLTVAEITARVRAAAKPVVAA